MGSMQKLLKMQYKKMKVATDKRGNFRPTTKETKDARKVLDKRIRSSRKQQLDNMDQHKLSTKAKRVVEDTRNKVEDMVSEAAMQDYDKRAGKLIEKGVRKVKAAKNWIKNNAGKATAAGVGGAAAVGIGASVYDKRQKDKTIARIKEKPASERTAQEKRMLRLLEEEDE